MFELLAAKVMCLPNSGLRLNFCFGANSTSFPCDCLSFL